MDVPGHPCSGCDGGVCVCVCVCVMMDVPGHPCSGINRPLSVACAVGSVWDVEQPIYRTRRIMLSDKPFLYTQTWEDVCVYVCLL